jgi:hypothetical protein
MWLLVTRMGFNFMVNHQYIGVAVKLDGIAKFVIWRLISAQIWIRRLQSIKPKAHPLQPGSEAGLDSPTRG